MTSPRRRSRRQPEPDRELEVRYEDLEELAARARADNPKAHDLEAIRDSVGAVGYVDPLVVNDADDSLLAGHGRLEVLRAMRDAGEPAPAGVRVDGEGRWSVPVLHGLALTPDQADRYVVAANQTTIRGGWDDDALVAYLERLGGSERGLAGTGFLEDDLGALQDALAGPMTAEERLREWSGMPTFDQADQMGVSHVVVHFRTLDDDAAFFRLLGQHPPHGRRGIWYPAAELDSSLAHRYVDPGIAPELEP